MSADLPSGKSECDHNCIPVSRWLRPRWVCVRCHRWFKVPPPTSWQSLWPAEQDYATHMRDVCR